MIKKKDTYDRIVHELTIFVNDIESKAENNLLDDNVFAEDIIKDLLNICMGWNLKNLNSDNKKFPGIDLGDIDRHIGVQVTSTKTSKKVLDSLDKIVNNGIDKDYNEIYFFILGRKQNSYSVDFAKYDTLDCSENNIWDISDIIAWCLHYDAVRIEQIWDVIKRDIVVGNTQLVIPVEIKKGILELKNTIHKVFEISNQLMQTHYVSETYVDEFRQALNELDKVLPYLDERTYFICKEVLESGLQLGETLNTGQKWNWSIKIQCIQILDRALVEKNLQETSELIEKDIPGLQKGIDIVIDSESLFERLTNLKIDEDIIYNQFSVIKFQRVIEDSILRKSKKCTIFFSKDSKYYNNELISRLEAEGTQILRFENRLQAIGFVCEQIRQAIDLVLISSSEDMVDSIILEKDNCYLYTVSLKNDLPARSVPIFFSKSDITKYGLNLCFNYDEGKTINIRNINEAIYRDMLANSNDGISHQLRVDCSGDVYISLITGAEEIDDVKFRWESWDAGNEYVGPFAASDYEYVKKSVASLIKCWEKNIRGYCDFYANI